MRRRTKWALGGLATLGLAAALLHKWLIALVAIAYVLVNDPFNDNRFDAALWHASRKSVDADNPRGPMAADVIQRLRREQAARERTLELLGAPDWPGCPPARICYMLGMWSGFRMDYDSLEIEHDAQGRFLTAYTVQH